MEFAYNKKPHSSIGMNPFETIYGDNLLALCMFSIYKWKLLVECLG
jgi:hypothetical protein